MIEILGSLREEIRAPRWPDIQICLVSLFRLEVAHALPYVVRCGMKIFLGNRRKKGIDPGAEKAVLTCLERMFGY